MNMYPRKASVNTQPEGISANQEESPPPRTPNLPAAWSWIVKNEFVFFFELEDNCFLTQTIQYDGNPSLCPNHNAEEAERFYEDLQDFR